jgi:unsaturated rhamnogalacturonyl hydrolase
MKRTIRAGFCAIIIAGCGGGNDAPASLTGSGSAGATGAAGTTATGGTAGTTGATGTGGTTGGAGSTGAGGSTGGSSAGAGGGTAADAGPLDASTSDATTSDAGADSGPGPAGLSSFDWGKAVIDHEIAGKTSLGTAYVDGLILHGIYKAYKRLKDPRYLAFLTKSADGYGIASGGSLDSIMHMTALVDAYELTMKASYKAPADGTRRLFDNYPTSTDGVFWHAKGASRAHQLWGDGVFMSMSFLSRYGAVFGDPSTYPLGVTQLTMTAKHLLNPNNGLLWHAYDESGVASWSNHPSKTNEIHWGRAMGWFGMASVMVLEALPAGDPGRPKVETTLADLVTALAKFQDPASGRWFQVVDMGSDARNWTETSASSMFTFVTWWAYRHGLVDASFAAVAKKGFDGVMQKVTKDAAGSTTIATICQGLNVSDDLVGNYYGHGVASNDPHGIGAFLLMWEGLQ